MLAIAACPIFLRNFFFFLLLFKYCKNDFFMKPSMEKQIKQKIK